jgi:hypothetical protein
VKKKRNPLKNWRWWVTLAPTLLIAMVSAALWGISGAGAVAGIALNSIHRRALIPMMRWTQAKRGGES